MAVAEDPDDRVWPWLSLVLLWLLFELPMAVISAKPDLSSLRFSLEMPLLATCVALCQVVRAGRLPRLVLRAVAVVLLAYRVDQWLCRLLMREDPLLYDQWFMVRHLWVLLSDLLEARFLLVVLAVSAVSYLLARLVRRGLARATKLLEPTRLRTTLRAAALIWSVLLALSWLDQRRAYLSWLSPLLAADLTRSLQVYRAIQDRQRNSPYAGFATLPMHERPDVLLFIVESYGRLLSVDDRTRVGHTALLTELAKRLANAGWQSASAFSTSTVSGGRSWIAEGSLLMGLPVHYEAEFQQLIAQRPMPPNLVGFLGAHGYRKVLLAPADRNRPGAHVVNRYGFDLLLTNEQVAYTGQPIGWGLVPDQYSLAVAEQRVLRDARQPIFLDFHMVSSHAPWAEVPTLLADPLLSSGKAAPLSQDSSWPGHVFTQLKRYERDDENRFAYMEQFDDELRRGYQATIDYDLQLITQYLERRRDDALVIVLGDHQPPVLSSSDSSFDSPIHVLSRDPRRLAQLMAHGFRAGLILDGAQPAALHHAGLFSLLVRSLVEAGCPSCALPPARPRGI